MKIIPRGKWVLVKPNVDESKENEYGLLLPANHEREQKARGTVVAVGSEVADIKKGSQVVYGAYAGENLKVKEKKDEEVEYKLLLDEDIIAFLES